MDVDAYRDLQLLTEISSGDSVTQRRLAKRYRFALGLTNSLMRRLVTKGYIKIVNLERKRLRYLLTPKGVAEKARLTYQYLDYSLALYRQVRTLLTRTLSTIQQSSGKDTVLYGTGEMAEITFVLMQQRGLNVVSVVEEPATLQAMFMGQAVRCPADLRGRSYDWVVIASFKDQQKIIQQLRDAGVPDGKIIPVSGHGSLAPLPGTSPEIVAPAPAAVMEARS